MTGRMLREETGCRIRLNTPGDLETKGYELAPCSFHDLDIFSAGVYSTVMPAPYSFHRVGESRIKRIIADIQDKFIGSHGREIRAQRNARPDHIGLRAPLNKRRETE